MGDPRNNLADFVEMLSGEPLPPEHREILEAYQKDPAAVRSRLLGSIAYPVRQPVTHAGGVVRLCGWPVDHMLVVIDSLDD